MGAGSRKEGENGKKWQEAVRRGEWKEMGRRKGIGSRRKREYGDQWGKQEVNLCRRCRYRNCL
jgi:hypothetical protein